jgi:predicted secreted protein
LHSVKLEKSHVVSLEEMFINVQFTDNDCRYFGEGKFSTATVRARVNVTEKDCGSGKVTMNAFIIDPEDALLGIAVACKEYVEKNRYTKACIRGDVEAGEYELVVLASDKRSQYEQYLANIPETMGKVASLVNSCALNKEPALCDAADGLVSVMKAKMKALPEEDKMKNSLSLGMLQGFIEGYETESSEK